MANIVDALMSLKPGAEFTLRDNDYSTIEWMVIEGDAPTQNEIDQEIKRLIKLKVTDENLRLAARADILQRLGITADEAALLLG